MCSFYNVKVIASPSLHPPPLKSQCGSLVGLYLFILLWLFEFELGPNKTNFHRSVYVFISRSKLLL